MLAGLCANSKLLLITVHASLVTHSNPLASVTTADNIGHKLIEGIKVHVSNSPTSFLSVHTFLTQPIKYCQRSLPTACKQKLSLALLRPTATARELQ